MAKGKLARHYILLGLIIGVGLLFRLHDLSHKGLFVDEFSEIYPTRCESFRDYYTLSFMYLPDHAPLFFLFRYIWVTLVGQQVWAAKLLGVLLGTVSIALAYLLATNVWNRTVGLWTALLFALSPCFIMQSQLFRSYPLLTAFYLLSLYAFTRALQDTGKTWWVLNIIVNVAAVYTHLFGAFIMLIQGLFLVLFDRRHLRLLTAWSAVQIAAIMPVYAFVLLYSPRDPGDVGTASMFQPVVLFLSFFGSDLSLWRNWRFFFDLAPDSPAYTFMRIVSMSSLGFISITYMACLTLFMGRFIARCVNQLREGRGQNQELSKQALLLLLTFVPWVVLLAVSLAWRNIFAPRFAWTFSTMALLMMLALALASIRRRWLKAFFLMLLFGAYACQLALYYPGPRGDGALGAGRMIKEAYQPGDTVIVTTVHTEIDQFRFEMDAPSIPLVPAYSTADICYLIRAQALDASVTHRAGDQGGHIFLVAFPMQAGIDQEAIRQFLDHYQFHYDSHYIQGELQCLIYRIKKRGIPPDDNDVWIRLFPQSAEALKLARLVGVEDEKAPLLVQSDIALRRAVGVQRAFITDLQIVTPLMVGFPILERGAPLFAERLARHLEMRHPDSVMASLLLATSLFEQGDEPAANSAMQEAMHKQVGFANTFSLMLVPAIDAIYVEKNAVSAKTEIERLEGRGVLFPNLFRVRAQELMDSSASNGVQ